MTEAEVTGRRVPRRSVAMGFAKLGISFLLAGLVYCAASYMTADQRAVLSQKAPAPAGSQVETLTAPGQRGPSVPPKKHLIPGSVQDFEKALEGMKGTSDLLVNWSIILLGGTIGVAILAKGAKIDDANWGLVLIPSTWLLLAMSLMYGSRFKGHVNFQQAHGEYVFRELNAQLFLQTEYFTYSVLVLIVLASWYLFFRFALWEVRGREDQE